MHTYVCCVYINVNPHKQGWRCVMGWRRPRHEADEVDAAGEHLEGVADAEGHHAHQHQPHGPGAERGGAREVRGWVPDGGGAGSRPGPGGLLGQVEDPAPPEREGLEGQGILRRLRCGKPSPFQMVPRGGVGLSLHSN